MVLVLLRDGGRSRARAAGLVLRSLFLGFLGGLLVLHLLGLGLRRRERLGPRRVAGLGGGEVEIGVHFVDLDERGAAGGVALLEAVAERHELHRAHLVGLVLEAFLERELEQAQRRVVVAGVVLHQPVLQRLLGLAERQDVGAARLRGLALG